jgi:predicted RNA-binding protein
MKKIVGNDELILNHPIMIQAQEKILEDFIPKNKIAFVSLCTATRPYSSSRKWKKFIQEFKDVDFIICSNAGIIPIEYETDYPFLSYDAHGEKKYDEMYIVYTTRSLMRFFMMKKYRYIVFNFRPTLRNNKSGHFAGKYLKKRKYIEDYIVTPTEAVYKEAQKDGFAKYGYSMYPDLHPIVLNSLHFYINKYKENEKDNN